MTHLLVPKSLASPRRWALPAGMAAFLSITTPAGAQNVPGGCPPAPDVVEGEICGDSVNEGCDGVQGQFIGIDAGDVVCAESWAEGGTRDQDWYRLMVADLDGSGRDKVRFNLRSSLPLVVETYQSCFDPPVWSSDCTFDAATLEWTTSFAICPEALTDVLLRISPGFLGSGPIVTGYPCAVGFPYVLEVETEEDCTETLCPECVRAPEGAIAWWMMDEPVGEPVSVDVVGNHNMSQIGGVTTGVVGQVDSAIELDGVDDHLRTADSRFLNFEENDDFSVMGWIRIDGGSSGSRVILSKATDGPNVVGYILGIGSTGQAIFRCNDVTGGIATVASPLPVPSDRWVHLAVTVDRDNPQGLRLYRDGVLVATQSAVAAAGDLTTDRPLYLGAYESPTGPINYFHGGLDEIVMVDYAIPSERVGRIAEAGCGGLCKQRLHVTRFTPFCDGDDQAQAVVTIFNDRNETSSYDVTFDGTPRDGDDCQIDGPIVFTSNVQNPVVVPPRGRQEVIVTIDRPVGMLEDGDAGCWRAKVEDTIRVSPPTIRRGFVIQSNQVCVEPLDFLPGVRAIPIGESTPFTFVVHNRGNTNYELLWKIGAIDPLSGQPNERIRLDNEEPGDPVLGLIQIPPGGSEAVSVDARWIFTRSDTSSTKGQILDVVMYEDPGKIDPDQGIGSKGGEAADRRSDSECVGADLDCDGDVDVNDLLAMLAAWGECDPATDCPEDLDGDGAIDVDDLLSLLAAFGTV